VRHPLDRHVVGAAVPHCRRPGVIPEIVDLVMREAHLRYTIVDLAPEAARSYGRRLPNGTWTVRACCVL